MKYFFLAAFLSLALHLAGQEKLPETDPKTNLQLARIQANTGSYNDAVALLATINENDSVYNDAIELRCNIYLEQEEYDELIELCDSLEGHYNLDAIGLINVRGLAQLRKEDPEAAAKTFTKGLEKYPVSYLLHYNLGIAYKNMEEYEKALEMMKKCIILNPYYAPPHQTITEIAYRENKITQAVLAWDTYLLLSPTAANSLEVLIALNSAVSEKNTNEPAGVTLSPDDESFEEIDLIVSNLAALSKGYKIKNKIKAPVVKQNHVILSKLSTYEGNDGFWDEKYVAFYKALFEAGYFDNFIYRIMMSSGSEKHQKIIRKHAREHDAFVGWAANSLVDIMGSDNAKFWGSEVDRFWYNSDGSLSYIGKVDENMNSYGPYTFYFPTGNIMSTGYFKDDERDKEWVWFDKTGFVDSKGSYTEGTIQGDYFEYYADGTLKERSVYKDNYYEGIVELFNPFGALMDRSSYAAGELQGKARTFYSGGEDFVKYDLYYIEGKLDSTAREYYSTGELKLEMEFDEGTALKETAFFRNSQERYHYDYKEGEVHGDYKGYFENGALEAEGKYVNGSRTGKWYYYYPDGTLRSEENYDEKGRLEGIYKEYSRTGKPYSDYVYSKDDIIAYKFYDTTGNVIIEEEKQNRKFDYQGYHVNGQLRSKGEYRVEGGKDGEWLYYDAYGNLTSREIYEDGVQNGPDEEFFSNGFLSNRSTLKDDELNGYYESYYINGTMEMQGYYEDGQMQGVWHLYYPDGTLHREFYMRNGDYVGFQYSYSNEGELAEKFFYKDDEHLYTVYFDREGNIMDTLNYGGQDEALVYYPNGKIRIRQALLYGQLHGKSIWYHLNGQVETEGEFYLSERTGPWTWYNEEGKVTSRANYVRDELDGQFVRYYSNGQMSMLNHYENGNSEGWHVSFSETGDTTFKGTYTEDMKHGPHYYYSDRGELQLVRYYDYDILTAYSYPAAEGGLIEPVPVEKGTATITSYYANGEKARVVPFKGGDFHGKYLQYHSNGQLAEESEYVAGIANGQAKMYYEDGTLKQETNYLNDALQGTYRKYHPNGQLAEEIEYRNDEPVGEAVFYDKNGRLIKRLKYFNGNVYEAEYF